LDLQTVVSTVTRQIQGGGDITQTTNPPLDVHTIVNGHYSQLGHAVVISLTGMAQPGTGLQNFICHIYLTNGWNQDGIASYRFLNNGKWQDVDNVKATPLHTEQPMTATAPGTTGRTKG